MKAINYYIISFVLGYVIATYEHIPNHNRGLYIICIAVIALCLLNTIFSHRKSTHKTNIITNSSGNTNVKNNPRIGNHDPIN